MHDLLSRVPDDERDESGYHAYFGTSSFVHLVPEGGIFGIVSSPSDIGSPDSIHRHWNYGVWQAVISRDIRGDLCRMYRPVKNDDSSLRERLLSPEEIDYFTTRWQSAIDSREAHIATVLNEALEILREPVYG